MVVLCSAPYMIPILERFQPVFRKHALELLVPTVEERLDEPGLLRLAGQFDGTICGDDQYTARVLEACSPRLRVISKWGTGVDSIDADACARLNIGLYRTPNAFTVPVADSVLGYMLAFARRLPWMDRSMKDGQWQKLPGRALAECTLGVIGIGNIGKAVTRRARAFGMRVLGCDIIEIAPDFIADTGIEITSLGELLSASDFISISCDLNSTSLRLIDGDKLTKTPKGAVLINTARGAVVNEAALIESLRNGHLGGAALDVFEEEPLPPESPLRAMSNVMLAPHNANSSPAAWENVHWNTLNNLLSGLGLPPEPRS